MVTVYFDYPVIHDKKFFIILVEDVCTGPLFFLRRFVENRFLPIRLPKLGGSGFWPQWNLLEVQIPLGSRLLFLSVVAKIGTLRNKSFFCKLFIIFVIDNCVPLVIRISFIYKC